MMRNHQASGLTVLLGMLLLTAGCRSLPHCDSSHAPRPSEAKPSPALLSQHVLEVSAEGFLFDLRPEQKPDVITNRVQLARYLRATIFDGFERSGKKKMLVFVHGGLTDRHAGMAHFWRSYEAVLRGEYYPVFVVWPSGWSATYVEHLLWVRQGLKAETPNERAFSLLTSPATLLADLGRSLTRLPLVIANNSRSDIETVTPIRTREGGAAVRQYQELAKQGYPVAIGDDYSRTRDRVGRGVTYWATLPAKYILGSFIDGFGKGAWDNMLRRTQAVYPARLQVRAIAWMDRLRETNALGTAASRPAETRRALSKRQERRASRYAAAGLPMFIEMLRRAQTNDPDLNVTLIGHSMGAIILNRVVRDAEMEFEHIVYLAAACSVEDFATSVLPYLREHERTDFYSLSLHPVAEAGEWQPRLGDLTPRGSLLVWIDNFLANPVTEQERTLGRWRNLYRTSATGEPIIHQLFGGERSRVKTRLHFLAFSVGFGGKAEMRDIKFQWNERPIPKDVQERCDTPLSHGEFSQMPYWNPAFWWQPDVSGGPEHQAVQANPVDSTPP